MPGSMDTIMSKRGVIFALMECLHCKTVIQEMAIFLIFPQKQCSMTVKGIGSGARLLGSSPGLTSYWLWDLGQVALSLFKIDFGERGRE